jgi:hypothetical protein
MKLKKIDVAAASRDLVLSQTQISELCKISYFVSYFFDSIEAKVQSGQVGVCIDNLRNLAAEGKNIHK